MYRFFFPFISFLFWDERKKGCREQDDCVVWKIPHTWDSGRPAGFFLPPFSVFFSGVIRKEWAVCAVFSLLHPPIGGGAHAAQGHQEGGAWGISFLSLSFCFSSSGGAVTYACGRLLKRVFSSLFLLRQLSWEWRWRETAFFFKDSSCCYPLLLVKASASRAGGLADTVPSFWGGGFGGWRWCALMREGFEGWVFFG